MLGGRERLVEHVEEPDPELNLLIALDREVLEQGQIVVEACRLPEVVRRHEVAVLAELRAPRCS